MRVFGSLSCSILSYIALRWNFERLIRTNVRTARVFEELRDYWYRQVFGGVYSLSLPLSSSRVHFSSKRSRVIRMPKILDARRASFRYRPAASAKR